MKCASVSNNIICKLDAGEKIEEKITEIINRYSIKAGAIMWAVGMIEKAEVGYLKGKEYQKDVMGQRMEVVSFHGSIAADKPLAHIHVSLADDAHNVHGGHFFSGIANPLLEIHIQKFDAITMRRKINENSGLNELFIP